MSGRKVTSINIRRKQAAFVSIRELIKGTVEKVIDDVDREIELFETFD